MVYITLYYLIDIMVYNIYNFKTMVITVITSIGRDIIPLAELLQVFRQEKMLHSGPFCPWRPELQHFGTVSQRILFNQGRVTHYYHRSTNLPSDTRDTRDGAAAPALGEWQEFQISWDQPEQQVVHPKL